MATCPDCRQRMQPFYVPSKNAGSAEVELDRCGQCSALWFNAGEIEAALGKTLRRRQGSSTRTCPSCRVRLEAAVLDGSIEVERCGSCQGVFLDGRDVAAITKTRKAVQRAPGGSGFVCESCGERRPFGEATSTVTGLVCAACAKPQEPEPPAEAQKRSVLARFMTWFSDD